MLWLFIFGVWGISATAATESPAMASTNIEFCSFWDSAVRNTERVPLNVTWQRDWQAPWTHLAYRVSFDVPGGNVWGYLSLPLFQADGPLPAEVIIADVGTLPTGPVYAEKRVVLILNTLPLAVGEAPELTLERFRDSMGKRDLLLSGAPGLNTSYLLRAVLGVNRAINWLANRREVDPGRIGVCAFGHAATIALMVAGLNQQIKVIVADKPVFFDGQKVFGSTAEWQKFAVIFDANNFAPKIKAEVRLIAGIKDTVATPEAIRMFGDKLISPKLIQEEQSEHRQGRLYQSSLTWMRQQIAQGKVN